ncbi:hypothetical protein PSTT_04743 [Puccinia striiformis]|uniref:Uncharacterized protein n=1 Tax=Puccinia striiformis TaxID=27350 RepID=A0A2S4VS19_9BASI|nr:hypothetical protein PSTT_04743 [Puccinia striiformis]
MAVRRVVEPACPSSWWAEPSARASKSDLLSDTHVREVLGQASPRTCRTGQSERSVYAVMMIQVTQTCQCQLLTLLMERCFPPPHSTLAKLKMQDYDFATPSTIKGGTPRILIPPTLPTLPWASKTRPAAGNP